MSQPPFIADAIAKEQAKRDAATSAIALLATLTEKLPAELFADLPVEHFHTGISRHESAWIKLRVADRSAAVAIADRFTRVPLAFVRGTFASIIPADRLGSERWHENADEQHTEIMSAYWAWSTPSVQGSKPELVWFVDFAPGVRVRFNCEITNDPARLIPAHTRDLRTKQIVKYEWSEGYFPHGEMIRFASGQHDKPGPRTMYFWQEPGGGAATLADLINSEGLG